MLYKIRPLDWKVLRTPGSYGAQTVFGKFSITRMQDGSFILHFGEMFEPFDTIEGAKLKAKMWYLNKLWPALEPYPPLESQSEG